MFYSREMHSWNASDELTTGLRFETEAYVSVHTRPLIKKKKKDVRIALNSPLSHGGHIVPGNQKSFVLPR